MRFQHMLRDDTELYINDKKKRFQPFSFNYQRQLNNNNLPLFAITLLLLLGNEIVKITTRKKVTNFFVIFIVLFSLLIVLRKIDFLLVSRSSWKALFICFVSWVKSQPSTSLLFHYYHKSIFLLFIWWGWLEFNMRFD